MKKLLCLLFVLQSVLSFGQNFWCTAIDTIPPDYYLGGKLDSVDLYFTFHSNTLPGLSQNRVEGAILPSQLIGDLGGVRFNRFAKVPNLKYSSLPHLGFGYVFGTQGTQWLTANYQQVINKRHTLNLNYDAGRSNGFLRNAFSAQHDLNLYYTYNSKRYAFDLIADYLYKDVNYNGGITTDSLLADFGLIYSPVYKENAFSKIRGTRISTTHYFSIVNSDTIQRLGVYLQPGFSIYNRKYGELNDTLNLIYNSINIDSLNTADQYQLNEVQGTAGVFLNSDLIKLRAGLKNRNWELINLGNSYTRNEVNILADAGLKVNDIVGLKAALNANLFGAQQEWETSVNAYYKVSKLRFVVDFSTGAKLPIPFQRQYYSNNLSYFTTNLQKQNYLHGLAKVDFVANTNFEIGLFGGFSSLSNIYAFNGVDWQQDGTFDGSYAQFGIRLHYGYKVLNIDLKGQFNSGDLIAKSLVQSRIFLQGKMFSGKLKSQIGAEVAYRDKQSVYVIHPLLDVYTLAQNQLTVDRFNLHAFLALELKQFRFFVRAENISYAWNKSEYLDGVGYPIPAMQIRLGFTWDFLN